MPGTEKIIYHVDAFTANPYKGNPAGVMISGSEVNPIMMQLIAAEMNLSETAFLNKVDSGYRIRFYTPESEIDLCGHATLSSAHILYETGQMAGDETIKFFSKAGELFVKKDGGSIIMDFPVYSFKRIDVPPNIVEITGFPVNELYECSYGWKLALLESEEIVKAAHPDQASLLRAGLGDLIITAPGNPPKYDFVVRCFVPELGIYEDPVTGSAHCALVPFWSARTGKNEFISHQVSRRGGVLRVSLSGNRVTIAGEAVTVFRSVLLV